ncbi:MAG: hypothetical protein ACOX68_03335 [Candidatus Limivicinus sp.]|jgi:multidrug efflux pump subunit AcrA (membrane-fusion protein)
MDTQAKSRPWVKDAAIVLLVVLLLLTFFSNTIMNHSLPEVATKMVTDGSITAKVRGTGTVLANGSHNVKAPANWTIGKVMVKEGQEIEAGDVLFVLGAGDTSELEEARHALEDLQVQYSQAALGVPLLGNHVGDVAEVEKLRKELSEAKRNLDDAANKISSDKIENLLNQKDKCNLAVTNARTELDRLQMEIKNAELELQTVEETVANLEQLKAKMEDPNYKPDESEEIPTLEEVINRLTAAQADKVLKDNALKDIKSKNDVLIIEQRNIIDEQGIKLNAINAELKSEDTVAYLTAEKAYYAAEAAYQTAYANFQDKLAQEDRSVQSAYVGLQSISNQIQRQKEKIKKLAGEGDENVITASVSGNVTEVNCTAGDTVMKDDILCVLEVPDMGYTVSFPVTRDQAKRLRVGDSAKISNYYWGNEIVATLSSIKTDKKNPMNSKILTFDLEGDVTSGAELTVSVGQKSANYDIIIPNSAIRNDSNGSFVLAVQAKNSPLGNRYHAKRVNIEVIAADDENSAVTADLSYGDYVITTGSAPIANGDQVRMADSQS